MTIDDLYDVVVQLCSEAGLSSPSLAQVRELLETGIEPEAVVEMWRAQTAATVDQSGQEVAEVVHAPSVDAPRMTEQDVTSRVASFSYALSPSGTLMQCEMIMLNGWAVIGKSGHSDPEKAKVRARTDAINQVWSYVDFCMREERFQASVAAR